MDASKGRKGRPFGAEPSRLKEMLADDATDDCAWGGSSPGSCRHVTKRRAAGLACSICSCRGRCSARWAERRIRLMSGRRTGMTLGWADHRDGFAMWQQLCHDGPPTAPNKVALFGALGVAWTCAALRPSSCVKYRAGTSALKLAPLPYHEGLS